MIIDVHQKQCRFLILAFLKKLGFVMVAISSSPKAVERKKDRKHCLTFVLEEGLTIIVKAWIFLAMPVIADRNQYLESVVVFGIFRMLIYNELYSFLSRTHQAQVQVQSTRHGKHLNLPCSIVTHVRLSEVGLTKKTTRNYKPQFEQVYARPTPRGQVPLLHLRLKNTTATHLERMPFMIKSVIVTEPQDLEVSPPYRHYQIMIWTSVNRMLS